MMATVGGQTRTERLHTISVLISAAGMALLLLGLAVDVALHARDPRLAAREGVVSLDNVGHLLLLIGITAAAIGIAGTVATTAARASWVRSGRGRAVAVVAPGVARVSARSAGWLSYAGGRSLHHAARPGRSDVRGTGRGMAFPWVVHRLRRRVGDPPVRRRGV